MLSKCVPCDFVYPTYRMRKSVGPNSRHTETFTTLIRLHTPTCTVQIVFLRVLQNCLVRILLDRYKPQLNSRDNFRCRPPPK
jgi:hypothetical protein